MYLLCRESDLGSLTAKIKVLEQAPGREIRHYDIDSRGIIRDRVYAATEFMHSLVREQIRKLEQSRTERTRTIAPRTYSM
jgi:hypothetical protein